MDEIDPLHALLRQAFCGHDWLLSRLSRHQAAAGASLQWASSASDHAEDCVRLAAGRMGEPDPFLPMPPLPKFDAINWFDVGFSALLLEVVTRHVQPLHAAGPDGNTPYGALAESFRDQRRFALKQAVSEGEASIKERIRDFVIPAVAACGHDFLREAVAALDGRLPRRLVLKEVVAALKEAGLPDDPWDYIEPQLDRYAKAFGIGFIKKKAIKAGLWLAK